MNKYIVLLFVLIIGTTPIHAIKANGGGGGGPGSDTTAIHIDTASEFDGTTAVSPNSLDKVLIELNSDGTKKYAYVGDWPTGTGMSNFSVAGDAGTPQTITDGNTLSILGGDGLASTASATDTVTIGLSTVTSTNITNAVTHITSDGSDHTFIDQDVTSGSTPTLTGTNFTGIPDGGLSSGATVISAGAGDSGKFVKLDAAGNVDATTINDGDIDHTAIANIGTNSHAAIDTHLASTANPHETINPIIIACSGTTANIDVATRETFRMPYAYTITDVRASLTGAPTGSGVTVNITESGVTIFSTNLTIDATETTSTTAAIPVVISDTALADDAEIKIITTAVGSTSPGTGLKVTIIGHAAN